MLRKDDDDSILAKRLDQIFNLKSDVEVETEEELAAEKYGEGFQWYAVVPRLDVEVRIGSLRRIVGDRFTLFYAREKGLRAFICTSASEHSLQGLFEVARAAPLPYSFAAVAKARRFRSDPYYLDFYIADLPGLAGRLPEGTAVSYGVSIDLWLLKYLNSKRARLEKRFLRARYDSRGIPELYEPLRKKLSEGFFLTSLAVFANSKKELKLALEIVKSSLSMPVSFSKRKLKEKKFYGILKPPSISGTQRFSIGLGLSGFLIVSQSKLDSLILPDPRMHDIPFVRSAAVPKRLTEEGEGSMRIGKLEDGKTFTLSPEDLFRHVYVIGQTGTGKTNLLKLLARSLHSLGYPVFVIDPHGDLGEELAETVSDAIYLHPTRSPFGINPLELPPLDDRNQAITISLDTLMNLFTNVFRLPETAVNVRYILQTVARQIYNVGGTPTLAGIYRIVMGIYNGADVGITDERFREQEKLLRNMPDQSFISTLGRLQSFAEDPILRKLTSSTTVDLDQFIDERKMVIFSVPQPDVGLVASTLVCSTLLLKIYYTVLARARRGERKNIFVIVDEFQTLQSLPILSNILSEARKFGLHLIIAHQYADQLTQEVFQAAMNNTGVKFVFQISGADVSRFRTLDPAFGEEIVRTATSLPTGKCLVKVTTRPEDAQSPPFIVEVRRDEAVKVREFDEVVAKGFEPEDVELDLDLVNPVLRYIDLPFPPRQKIIKALYEAGGEATATELYGHVAYIRQDAFNKILSSMQARGYIRVRRAGKSRIVTMTEKFFEDFYKVSPSDKGMRLIRLAVLYYMQHGYYVAPTKNVPIPRPDLVAIPYKDYYLDYSKAIEVEIEATTAEKMPEHLSDTARKGTPFKEKHVWCFEEDFPRIVEFLTKSEKEVTIFRVSGDRIEPIKLEETGELLRSETQQELKPVDVLHEESGESGEESRDDLLLRAFELLDEDLVYELDELALLDIFIEIVSDCISEIDEKMRKRIADAAKAVIEDPSKIADLCQMLSQPELDEEAMAAVAEAVRMNEKLKGREDIVDEMLIIAGSEEGREVIKEIAKMNLDADLTLRILRVLNTGGLEYFKPIERARNLLKILEFLERKLGIEAPKCKVENTKTPRPKFDEEMERRRGKKRLSDLIINTMGENVEEMREKRRKVTIINGRKLVVLRGDRQRLKIEAGSSDIYLADERKVPVHGSSLPTEGLLRLQDAPPGKYTLLVVRGGEIVKRYVVEVLE